MSDARPKLEETIRQAIDKATESGYDPKGHDALAQAVADALLADHKEQHQYGWLFCYGRAHRVHETDYVDRDGDLRTYQVFTWAED